MLVRADSIKPGDEIRTGLFSWGIVESITRENHYFLIDTGTRVILKHKDANVRVRDEQEMS